MSRINILNCIIFCTYVAFFCSCKTTKNIESPKIKEVRKLEEKKAGDLQNLILENTFKTKTLSARVSVSTDIKGNKTNFTINIRMKSDSIIWISISPLLGIEVARVVATQDSIKFLDRLKLSRFQGVPPLSEKYRLLNSSLPCSNCTP